MVTVSDIKFIPDGYGHCPGCGRRRKLGRINTNIDDKSKCIDCYFGPPMEFWEKCTECGQLYVGDSCDNPYCEIGKTKYTALDLAIMLILSYGFAADGQTMIETYKIITQKSYPLPGAIVTTGGRQRFKNDDWKVTVGKFTTFFYKIPENPDTVKGQGRLAGKAVMTGRDWTTFRFRTKDIKEIENKLSELGFRRDY